MGVITTPYVYMPENSATENVCVQGSAVYAMKAGREPGGRNVIRADTESGVRASQCSLGDKWHTSTIPVGPVPRIFEAWYAAKDGVGRTDQEQPEKLHKKRREALITSLRYLLTEH